MRSLQARTFRLDLLRAFPHGVVETLVTTFAVLIAVRHFEFGIVAKAVLVGSVAAGLLASLFTVPLVRRLGWTAPRACAIFWLAASISLGLVFALPSHPGVFLACVMLAGFLPPLSAPLIARIYRENYGDTFRGRLFSLMAMAKMATAMVAALLIGRWLDRGGIGQFDQVFLLYSLCAAAAALCLWKMEGRPLEGRRVRLLAAFRHVRHDAAFRKLLIAWMFIGLGNLTAVAVFVDYAANPAHKHDLSATAVGILTGTLPTACALLSLPAWGWMFDRAHFYRVRVLINLMFLLGIAVYFSGGAWQWMAAGMAFHGLARAGGQVSWSLWVTKFSDGEDTAEYMSVHTFLTGLRGVLAPFLGFFLLDQFGPVFVAMFGSALILIGTAVILPEAIDRTRHGGRAA